MLAAVFKVMFLSLIRDRGAVVLAFLLPPVIYVLFAAIFSGTASDDLRLRLAVFDGAKTETSRRLIKEVDRDGAFRPAEREAASQDDVSDMVRLDQADVGLVVRSDPSVLESTAGAALLIVGDQSKAVAAPIAMGQLQRIIAERLPDVAYRRVFGEIEQNFVTLEPVQKQRVAAILDQMETDAVGRADGTDTEEVAKGSTLIERQNLEGRNIANPSVVYYAGAVAMMFLLFAAQQGAMKLIDERQSGVLDRVLFGIRSSFVLIFGKFLFLTVQGVVQVSLIFIAAAVIYGVDILPGFQSWLLITVSGAALAASAGLLLCAAARSRQQAETLSTFAILVLSAVGGSMVPRFMMPTWLQDASWAVPNAWVIEAYHGLLWRGAGIQDTLPLVYSIIGVAVLCLVSATALLHLQNRR